MLVVGSSCRFYGSYALWLYGSVVLWLYGSRFLRFYGSRILGLNILQIYSLPEVDLGVSRPLPLNYSDSEGYFVLHIAVQMSTLIRIVIYLSINIELRYHLIEISSLVIELLNVY